MKNYEPMTQADKEWLAHPIDEEKLKEALKVLYGGDKK